MKRSFIFVLLILCLLCPGFPAYSSDTPEFTLNRWREVKKGEKFTFYENDLADRMMEIRKDIPPGSINMLVSLDGGNVWNDMDQKANYYVYRHIPATGEVMRIIFSWTDENGFIKTSDTETSLTFISND
ncbi:MAG: hypothetical protein WCV56_08815 [Candidatus Omnitrophota bacterium]